MIELENVNILLAYKKRLQDSRVYSITLIIFAVLIGIGIYQYRGKLQYRTYLENQFQESFYEVMNYVRNVDSLLGKMYVTNKPSQRVSIFADIYKDAWNAQGALGKLPYAHQTIDETMHYLTQVSDFSYAMLVKMGDGGNFSTEDENNMDALLGYSQKLTGELNKIRQNIDDGNRVVWGKIQKESEASLNNAVKTSVVGSMSEVRNVLSDYPSLIYDGPFSEHIEQMESTFLKSKNMVTAEKAQSIAKMVIGEDKIQDISMVFRTETKEKFVIPVYRFEVTLKTNGEEKAMIDITQQGGAPYWMLRYNANGNLKTSSSNQVDRDVAQSEAKKFLDRIGYMNMEVNYFEEDRGVIVFNFAYMQEGVTMYSDLVKVKVSMENAEIMGFEALGYIMMHKERTLEDGMITEEKAREELSKSFIISRSRRAVIPLDSKKEVGCYEFLGKVNGKEYLVYVNAQNARQEKILQVIRGTNGVFTQ